VPSLRSVTRETGPGHDPTGQSRNTSLTIRNVKLDFVTKDIAFVDLAFANVANLFMVYNYLATLVEMLNSFK